MDQTDIKRNGNQQSRPYAQPVFAESNQPVYKGFVVLIILNKIDNGLFQHRIARFFYFKNFIKYIDKKDRRQLFFVPVFFKHIIKIVLNTH